MSENTHPAAAATEQPTMRRARTLLAALSWSQPPGSSANHAHIWLEAGSPIPLSDIDTDAHNLLADPPTLQDCEAALQDALDTSTSLEEMERIGRALHHLHATSRPLV